MYLCVSRAEIFYVETQKILRLYILFFDASDPLGDLFLVFQVAMTGDHAPVLTGAVM